MNRPDGLSIQNLNEIQLSILR